MNGSAHFILGGKYRLILNMRPDLKSILSIGIFNCRLKILFIE